MPQLGKQDNIELGKQDKNVVMPQFGKQNNIELVKQDKNELGKQDNLSQ